MSKCAVCGVPIGRDQLGYFTHPANGCSSAPKPVSPSPDLGGLIGRLERCAHDSPYMYQGDHRPRICRGCYEPEPGHYKYCAHLLLREALTVLRGIGATAAKKIATCPAHGDPLVCLACEMEENARPEWRPPDSPFCEIRSAKDPTGSYICELEPGHDGPHRADSIGLQWDGEGGKPYGR